MCYSSALRKKREKIEKELCNQIKVTFDDSSTYKPYFHLNGFTHGNLQIIKMDEPNTIYDASWGIIPDWAVHDPEVFRKKSNTLNARSESIFDKASFRNSAEDKRCLILADGFYEPHHENGKAIPYFCFQPSDENPDGDVFLFAGLYNDIDDNTLSTTILTTDANDFFMGVHNKGKRMPLVLDPHYFKDWLDEGLSIPEVNELMAVGMTNKPFSAHPVSSDLYKRNVDTNKPYIIQPVQKDTLF